MRSARDDLTTRTRHLIRPFCGTALIFSTTWFAPARAQTNPIQVTVPGTAMPWLWAAGGQNSADQFGAQDGTNPVVVDVSAAQGGTISVQYVSGTVNTDPALQGSPNVDANGNTAVPVNDGTGSTGTVNPSFYMKPYPIYQMELVGTFADSQGNIVGTPFALGDGPTSETVPPGATQLQLGTNDDKYSDNTGSWAISVSIAPPTPQIAFNGSNIAGTTQSVVIGQQISLEGSPALASGQIHPWTISGGKPVGGFFRGGDDGRPEPLALSSANTTFYWTTPGTYVVTYTPNSATQAAKATFSVAGPSVSVQSDAGEIVDYRYDSHLRFSCGKRGYFVTHCASFYVTGESLGGTFKWAQIILKDLQHCKTIDGKDGVLDTPVGLDVAYNLGFLEHVDCYGALSCFVDSPDVIIDKYRLFQRNFLAHLFLMWNANLKNGQGIVTSIDVPLGSVYWYWYSVTRLDEGKWTEPMPSRPYVDSFRVSPTYPTWDKVLPNGQSCQ